MKLTETEKAYLRKWVKAALIRAVKTAAQTALGCMGAGAVLTSIDWAAVACSTVLAAVLSILTSIAGLPEVDCDYSE